VTHEHPGQKIEGEGTQKLSSQRRLILAASTGGHLAQLVRLAPTLNAADDSLWVTFESPQSRSLLKDRNVLYVPYVAPRDARAVVRSFLQIKDHLAKTGISYDEAISTGSGLALAALPAARISGIPARYIESVSRTDGPSLSGRILHALRFCRMEAQHEKWVSKRWTVRPSVMGTFTATTTQPLIEAPRLFVTLGTIKPYRFDAAVDAVLATGLATSDTVWQVGTTSRVNLPGKVFETVEDDEFSNYIEQSDVVITHSGVGSILKILDLGKYPIVIPRRAERGEHIDNHQLEIARLVTRHGIASAVEADQLTRETVLQATTYRVHQAGEIDVH
jgi:UDP-N-acetylglucosamine--N-acetylmuramyl-(pentapeptide) pyrophosphoryl-undecaprenol N-acetylglucosamine transferase